jgi:hypothetical protein
MQSERNEPPADPRAPPEDQAMVEVLTNALDQRIADHVTGQPTRIAVPVLIDVLTAYLIDALRKCETYAERQQWLQRAVDHLRLRAERP